MMKTLEQIFLNIMRIQALPQNFENLKIGDVEKWDSLNHVSLILAIESKFNIKIKPEDSIELTSYKKILNFIKNF